MEVMAESKVWNVWTFLLTHFDKPTDDWNYMYYESVTALQKFKSYSYF